MKRFVFFALIIGLVILGCENGNGSNEDEFVTSTNETVSNDVATLGLTGTTVSSSNTKVATVEITASAKIKITSVSEGLAVITVSDDSSHNATINVSVSKTGLIKIDKIVKYETQNEDHSQLPEPAGNNELGGKIYNNSFSIIEFNADSSYTLSVKRKEEEMFIMDTGFYSWNTPQKMVILKTDKTDPGSGTLLNESEFKEFYMEYLSSLPSEELELPSGRTIEQYVAMLVKMVFLPQTYNYVIENGEITYLGIKCTPDTGTTISGCGYSQKAATRSFGTHYLLNISFDEALVILTAAYGQPEDGWAQQSDSDLSDRDKDWVILEYTRYNDIRLHKNESDERTTKGWLKTNLP